MDRIAIIFDTNIIESRFSDNQRDFLFHGKITPSKIFYDIVNYIISINRRSNVDLYIHSVSWCEYYSHLKENAKKRIKDLNTDLTNYKKSFGSLFDSVHEFKLNSDAEYEQYIYELGGKFLTENNCTIMDYPNDIVFFKTLLEKCMQKKKPFIDFKSNGKQYHDGGFKDAVIIETIREYQTTSKDKCIFVTNDKDFNWVTDLCICNDIESFKTRIGEILKINDSKIVEKNIMTNPYFKEQLITATGNAFSTYNESVDDIVVNKIANNEDDNFVIDIQLILNEVCYLVEGVFDPVANDFLNISYQIKNE